LGFLPGRLSIMATGFPRRVIDAADDQIDLRHQHGGQILAQFRRC
jgi:hypothetical protein